MTISTRSFISVQRRAVALIIAVCAVFTSTSVSAQFAIPGFELVHNAPAETSLATPDLRDAAAVWRDMIDHARHDIVLEQFYVAGRPGSALDGVIAALDRAGRRGVHIRFLMEAKGIANSDQPTIDRLKAIPHLEFRILAWSDVGGSGIIHAKFIVVDGREAYLGSQNFDWRSLEQIDETGLRISRTPITAQLHRIFEWDWEAQARIARGDRMSPLRAAPIAGPGSEAFLVASPNAYDPAGIADSQTTLVALIGAAKRQITVEVMEYSTTAFGGGSYTIIDDALRAAVSRGVHVRLLVADWNVTAGRLPGLMSLAALPGVEIRVARIPQLASGAIPYARVVHAKTMTIDDSLAWIGTSNWEGGYLDTSRNVEMVLRSRRLTGRVAALQDQLWTSTYAVSLAEPSQRLSMPK